MTKTKIVVGAIAALGISAGSAFAQAEDGTMESPPPPPLVTPQGKINVHVGIGIGLSKELAGKPIAISPDIFYGVMPKLEVGLAHSGYALDGFWGDTTPAGILGTGVCVSGDDGGCASVYNGPVGLLGRFAIMEGDIDLAADGGVVIRSIDSNGAADEGDLLLGLKLGVRGRKMFGKVAVGFAPNVQLGLNLRDGNGDSIHVPVDVMFAVNEKLGVGLQTGIQGPLEEFGDNFFLPIGVGGMFMVNENIGAGAAFILHRVTGGGDNGPDAADLRSLQLFVGWHN